MVVNMNKGYCLIVTLMTSYHFIATVMLDSIVAFGIYSLACSADVSICDVV
jgi:hypothetical protein